MNIYEQWEKALKITEVIRPRIMPLLTYAATELPYVFLAESAVNKDTTVVRQGKVNVEKPTIFLPPNSPQFDGFEMNSSEIRGAVDFLLLRGVFFPSMKYNNQICYLDVYDDKLSGAVKHYKSKMQKAEDVNSGLILGPEDCWQMSVMVFVCQMVSRSAEDDIKKLMSN